MHRLLAILIVISLVFAQAAKPNVSVLKFEGKGVSDTEAEAISDLFSGGLVSSGAFTVLDRANVNALLTEQSFQASGCTDSECAVEIGKMLNMDYMFTGSVLKLGDNLYITANKVSIETGKIEQFEKSAGFTMNNVDEEINLIVSKFARGYSDGQSPAGVHESMLTPRKPAKAKSPGARNPARIITMISGITLLTGGAAMTGVGFGPIKGEAESAYSAYSAYDGNDALLHDNNWQEYLNKHEKMKISIGASYALLGTGAALLITSFIIPKNKKGAAAFQTDGRNFRLTYSINF